MRFQVKGWCPSTLRPMMSGDGLLVRIRPPLARLTMAQARGLAEAARQHGNGLIDLSSRGNIQLRGIGTHAALLRDMTGLGLIDETSPNTVVSPFWGQEDGTETIQNLLQLQPLPDKFGFAIDVGPEPVLQTTSADIRIERHPEGYLIRPDGTSSGAIATSADHAADLANQLAEWFVTHAKVKRMAEVDPTHLPPAFGMTPMTIQSYRPEPGLHQLGRLFGLAFGQITAETLAAIAQFPLRVTPWRMILTEGQIEHPDLITMASDPRLRVTACTGAPGCPQALQPTRPLAEALAPQVPPGKHLHVSGCAKGCAHPRPAAVTLCGTETGFDLIRNGRASDPAIDTFNAATSLFKAL
ncbi:MAG: precorrin-3B synthase [bacterium]